MKLLRILALVLVLGLGLRLGLALGVVLPQLVAAPAPGLATFPVGTTTVTASALAANLSTIWELAWGPDNFIWMTERGGRISRVNPATGQVSVLLALPDVTESNESGLLGLAVMEPFPASGPLVASEAQNRASLNGKILRMSLDGTIPADNPAPGSLVYTLGHRNPQGLVQLPNGRIYSSEHGPNTDDEVNRIEAGRNYGWPNVEGYCDLSAEATFCAANNVREPLTAWTPTIAPAGLSYYDHPAIPGWRGSLLLAVLKGSKLTQLTLDAAGGTIPTRTDYLTGFGRLRAICVSPQGRVYVGTSNRDGRGNPAATDDRILVLQKTVLT